MDWHFTTGEIFGFFSLFATIIVTAMVQAWGFYRWLATEFAKRDRELSEAVTERQRILTALRAEATVSAEKFTNEFKRVDMDIMELRGDMRERFAAMPSRQDIDQLLRDRVQPIEQDLRSLVFQLAKIGVKDPRGERT